MEEQIAAHYQEMSDALKWYLHIEDIISGIYAEYTIKVQGLRFCVATGIKLLKEMEVVDVCYGVEEFKIELKYAIEKFNLETKVLS